MKTLKLHNEQTAGTDYGHRLFWVNGQDYLGELSRCECGALCAVNMIKCFNAPFYATERVRVEQLPYEVIPNDDGSYSCEYCAE